MSIELPAKRGESRRGELLRLEALEHPSEHVEVAAVVFGGLQALEGPARQRPGEQELDDERDGRGSGFARHGGVTQGRRATTTATRWSTNSADVLRIRCAGFPNRVAVGA